MTEHSIDTRGGLPQEMQILLRDYPRDAWPDHPNFAASIANWMGAHQMFRDLAAYSQTLAEAYLDKAMDQDDFVSRFAWGGDRLVRNLHGHHGWEDHRFFPELKSADRRFADGLDMLETDHEALDGLLERFTTTANRAIQLHQLDTGAVRDQVGALREMSDQIGTFLNRHLSDEEDLAVPILLHHKLRG